MNAKTKQVAFIAVALVGVGAVLLSGERKAHAQDADDEEDDGPGLPQALPPAGSDGWPLPSGVTMPQPQTTSPGLPQVNLPAVIDMPEHDDEPDTSVPPTPTMTQGSNVDTDLDADTAKLLSVMLALESTSSWKRVEADLKPWQSRRGLKADGKFGPKSAARMAQETGLLPIIRFWTAGTSPETAVPAYHDALIALANQAEQPRRTHLLAAVERERGQGFARNPSPISPLITLS